MCAVVPPAAAAINDVPPQVTTDSIQDPGLQYTESVQVYRSDVSVPWSRRSSSDPIDRLDPDGTTMDD
eukprot:scaffold442861_cov59-Attheya_sp.AAC.2